MNRKPMLLIAGVRAARLLPHILQAIWIACIYPALGKPAQRRIMQRWSQDLLHILNVSWHAGSHPAPCTGRGQLIVANHISWLDVFAMNAAVPARFIAKSEVGGWPLVGWLSQRTGALFIRRDMMRDMARVNRRIAELLQQGECVALFPEGTSTDGTGYVHFNPALLQGAIDAGAGILPVAVHYHDGSGLRLDDAAFIGDMTFMQSLWNILRSPCLHVSVVCQPAIRSDEKTRRALAQEAQQAVNAALGAYSGACRQTAAASRGRIHQSLTCSSSCGNIAPVNSFPGYLGEDDAEPDPAATPAT